MSFAMHLKTFGAISFMEFVGIDGKMAMTTLKHVFLFRQQDKGKVSACSHIKYRFLSCWIL